MPSKRNGIERRTAAWRRLTLAVSFTACHYPNFFTGGRFLLPRSGLMTLAVGFNPRSAGYFDRPVASATIESGVRLIRLAGSPVEGRDG
jgi:hypothetical protein